MQGDLKFSQEWTKTLRLVAQSRSASVLRKAAVGWWDDRCLSMGAAIAFYAIFSLPLGRLADGWIRTRLLSISILAWSGAKALGGFANGGESRNEEIVESLAGFELCLELGGARFERIVRQRCDLRFQRVDRGNTRLISLDAAVVGRAEELAGERADHHEILSLAMRPEGRGMVQRSPSLVISKVCGGLLSGPRCGSAKKARPREMSGSRAIRGSMTTARPKSRLRHRPGRGEIWPVWGVVNGANLSRISSF